MKIQNHIFDNVKLNIVKKNDKSELIDENAGIYMCCNDDCGYVHEYRTSKWADWNHLTICTVRVNISESDLAHNDTTTTDTDNNLITLDDYPDTIKCPECGHRMVHKLIIANYKRTIRKVYDDVERGSLDQLNAAKFVIPAVIEHLQFIKENKLKSLYDSDIGILNIIIHLGALAFDNEALDSLEKLIDTYKSVLNYKDYKNRITIARKVSSELKEVYAYIQPNTEYMQTDLVKELAIYESQNQSDVFRVENQSFFISRPHPIISYQDLFYCWWKLGLLMREKRKNRVYLRKAENMEVTI